RGHRRRRPARRRAASGLSRGPRPRRRSDRAGDMTATTLPIASRPRLRREVRQLLGTHRRAIAWIVVLHVIAALIAVIPPRLLGGLVAAVESGTTRGHVDHVVLLLVGVVVVQAFTTRAARFRAYAFAERILADMREGFIGRVLGLPLGVVEQVRSGDLLNRATNDVDTLTRS